MSDIVYLDGNSLTVESLCRLSLGNVQIALAEEAVVAITASRNIIDQIISEKKVAYGINTGFGLFSEVVIEEEQLEKLQLNLIRSHAAGVGDPLTRQQTRMLLALRINVLARGHSGVRLDTVEKLVLAFNADCLSVVPCQGTVGASGDLAPLSHLCLGLLGEGLMWDPLQPGLRRPASEVLASCGLSPIVLGAKEGLALINGTQMITSLGVEAVMRARNVLICADLAAALTLECLKGTVNAFHPRIHQARPHPGQLVVAGRMRAFLQPDGLSSELFDSHKYTGKVQDAYSLRCVPQVHGVALDTLTFVASVIDRELNSSTDNPMVFTGDERINPGNSSPRSPVQPRTKVSPEGPLDASDITDLAEARREIQRLRQGLATGLLGGTPNSSFTNTLFKAVSGFVISGGNFHGEYPSKMLDFLAISTTEIANISERRIERLVNPQLSGLPAFLVTNGGLNSGFMIAHCTAAALASENKTLAHPASVDSISTSAAKEDHVSMGGFAARKCLQVIGNVETVVAIELLAACQALEFHRPLRTTPVLEEVHRLVRSAGIAPFTEDRFMAPDIEKALALIRGGEMRCVAEKFLASLDEV